jgi:hypothetical protein
MSFKANNPFVNAFPKNPFAQNPMAKKPIAQKPIAKADEVEIICTAV